MANNAVVLQPQSFFLATVYSFEHPRYVVLLFAFGDPLENK